VFRVARFFGGKGVYMAEFRGHWFELPLLKGEGRTRGLGKITSMRLLHVLLLNFVC